MNHVDESHLPHIAISLFSTNGPIVTFTYFLSIGFINCLQLEGSFIFDKHVYRYFRLNKAYEAIENGNPLNAITDMTGNVCEHYRPDTSHCNILFHILYKSCIRRWVSNFTIYIPKEHTQRLRIPDSYDAKIAKICNLWTLWLVIQLINHLLKIRQKSIFAQCSIDVKSAVTVFKLVISLITGHNVQRLKIFAIFAS